VWARRGETADAGSAPVEFALISVLVVVLFLAVLQLGIALYVRNTLQAAATDGARYGAVAGRDPNDASARTRRLIDAALAERFADHVTARPDVANGIPVVVVDVRAALPVLGPWGPSGALHVRACAFEEAP
jgi:Flp pilus assembly protein TadG